MRFQRLATIFRNPVSSLSFREYLKGTNAPWGFLQKMPANSKFYPFVCWINMRQVVWSSPLFFYIFNVSLAVWFIFATADILYKNFHWLKQYLFMDTVVEDLRDSPLLYTVLELLMSPQGSLCWVERTGEVMSFSLILQGINSRTSETQNGFY